MEDLKYVWEVRWGESWRDTALYDRSMDAARKYLDVLHGREPTYDELTEGEARLRKDSYLGNSDDPVSVWHRRIW